MWKDKLDMTIEEQKILIAKHMGYTKGYNRRRGVFYYQEPKVICSYYPTQLRFDSNWHWLMPVWFDIMNWGINEYGVFWKQHICDDCILIDSGLDSDNVYFISVPVINGVPKITDIFEVVVRFIIIYNSRLIIL